ncbi:hypothetical protein TNCV_2571551 [Trichonephila clavipes]|nr:hypothetical protein TNCV_2571551 [Trichonephila clavipes]
MRARPLPRIKLSKATFVGKVSPPPPPTPVHKLTEKTNENSNKVSHGIQAIENENSDLAQVIELVMSSSPVPLKTHGVGKRLICRELKRLPVGMVSGFQLRCRPRHLTMAQNYEARGQKPSCS